MGIMKEFAQDLSEVMGIKSINQDVLEVGQAVLDAKGNPIELMKIAKHIRKERLIRVCCVCKRWYDGDRWVNPKVITDWQGNETAFYPQGQQTHTFCPECYNGFYKDEIEAGILTAV